MSDTEIQQRYEAARQWAVEAGKLTLKFFQNDNFTVERKDDQSPVTVADRGAEELLRQRIAGQFPHDSIVGEEFGIAEGTSGYRWILDPIDGTKSFISGVPLYGTMIGVEQDDQCKIGVVYIPGLDEGVYACEGNGCLHVRGTSQPTVARVSDRKLSEGLFVTSEVRTFAKRDAEEAYLKLQQLAYISRSWGDCYGYLLVATGRAELMVDPMLSVWDAAAVKPIIEEAGGAFVDWQGVASIRSGEAIGSNQTVLDETLEILRKFPALP